MAYNTKYQCSFKDVSGNDIEVHIQQDGWPAFSITDVKTTGDPLYLEWPSERGDIFKPVRGAVANLSFYAETSGQFNEFFDGNTKEYKMVIYFEGSIYWSGFLMLSDYQESLQYPPYQVNVMAYDLGFLQSSYWDSQYHDDDTILDVIYRILDGTYLDLGVIERVNIYDDTLTKTSGYSMLDLINIHPTIFMDDSWSSLTLYEALERLLIPFNAFIMQENGTWNICRVPDMAREHNQRTYAYPQLLTTHGTEDTTSDLSNYTQLFRSGVLLSCANYRTLNFGFDQGLRNIVNNGLSQNYDPDPLDYWNITSGSGTLAYAKNIISGGFPTIVYDQQDSLKISSGLTQTTIYHEKSYAVNDNATFKVDYGYSVHRNATSSPTCTKIRIEIKLYNGSFTYYLNMATGAWSTTSSVSDITFSSTSDKSWTSTSLITGSTPIDGTLEIRITEANWSGLIDNKTYVSLNITPLSINRSGTNDIVSLKETIDADSLEDLDLTFYLGDTDTDSRDLLFGSLTIASSGAATDLWVANSGSVTDELLTLTKEVYRAQYETPARRIQANLRGDLDYLTVLVDADDRKYIASSITKNFKERYLQGEWIEIKTGWGDDLVDSWVNGAYGGSLYEGFTDYGSYLLLYKIQTTTNALVTLNNTPLVEGVRYKITADISMTSGSIPNVSIGGTAKTDLIDGYNEWEVVADTTESTHYGIIYNTSAEQAQFTIALTVQEAYGI